MSKDDNVDEVATGLVGALMEDEMVFDDAVQFLRGLSKGSGSFGNAELSAAYLELATALERFDRDRTAAVMKIVTLISEKDDDDDGEDDDDGIDHSWQWVDGEEES